MKTKSWRTCPECKSRATKIIDITAAAPDEVIICQVCRHKYAFPVKPTKVTESKLYYECHITVEPVFDDRLETFRTTVEPFGFRVADLLMKKRETDTAERSQYDTFCTGRSKHLEHIEMRMNKAIHALIAEGFKVWRYKIEDTLLDSRHEDLLGVIKK